jgi:DNA excision repair protein ERCC-4
MARPGPILYDQLERLTERYSNNSSSRRGPTTKRTYGCIDGVGPELAATLYDASPSVADLLVASGTDLEALEGIGAQRARTIRATVRGTDR